MPKPLCGLKLPVVSPQVWESEMCKDNTLGTVQETLLCVEHKYHLFVKDLENEKEWGNGEQRERYLKKGERGFGPWILTL